MYRSSAVSEVIGSILLISLVVLAVAVIGAGFLSQPPPVQTQDLNVIASNTTTTLYIYHDGGDPMVPGEFALLLDGNPVDPIPAPSGGWPWEIGEVLEIPITTTPQRIQIISLRGGQQNLIREISIGQVTGGGVPITPGTPPTPGPGGQCTQEELDEYAEEYLEDNYVEYFSDKLNSSSIYLFRERRGTRFIEGWINMTINSTDSYLVLRTDGRVNLLPGDKLSILYRDRPQATASIFTVGERGWTVAGDETWVYIDRGGVVTLYQRDLLDSWLTKFVDGSYQTSLSFRVGGTPAVITRLVLEGDDVISGVSDSSEIQFNNIRPAEPMLFILDYQPDDGKTKIRFIGLADSVTRGGTPIYP